jgi:Tfp pilus assembly protein PilP
MICSRAAQNRPRGGFWAKLASILLLAVVCCRASRADEYSYIPVIESRASATVENQTAETSEKAHQSRVLSRLMPAQKDQGEQQAIQSSEPQFEALTEDISAKWADAAK